MEPDAVQRVNGVEMNMSLGSNNESAAREQLSAMADGELDGAAVGQACAGWRADAVHRATWHAYHLIGDVMRSDDLASVASRDAAFLGALRARLASEPVVLAPAPAVTAQPESVARGQASRRSAWSWMAPTAVAAGFVAVAGVLVVTRGAGPSSGAPVAPAALAQAALPAAAATRVADAAAPVQRPVVAQSADVVDVAAEPQVLVVNGQLIRDARLDRYLAAHKQFAGSSALGVPSAFLRSATADASAR
jgi:sigma-E factor negative regulatory protein RseA